MNVKIRRINMNVYSLQFWAKKILAYFVGLDPSVARCKLGILIVETTILKLKGLSQGQNQRRQFL
jgi:hypothetical protein